MTVTRRVWSSSVEMSWHDPKEIIRYSGISRMIWPDITLATRSSSVCGEGCPHRGSPSHANLLSVLLVHWTSFTTHDTILMILVIRQLKPLAACIICKLHYTICSTSYNTWNKRQSSHAFVREHKIAVMKMSSLWVKQVKFEVNRNLMLVNRKCIAANRMRMLYNNSFPHNTHSSEIFWSHIVPNHQCLSTLVQEVKILVL